jgi:ribosomal protein S18 acetylase RimI-like enzyme
MTDPLIAINTANSAAIEAHLRECDARFSPRLSDRVDLGDYARKLADFSDRVEVWQSDRLVGLVAAYLSNCRMGAGYISSVSVCSDVEGRGIASKLIRECRGLAEKRGLTSLGLEVASQDDSIQAFYRKHGFELSGEGKTGFLRMSLELNKQ